MRSTFTLTTSLASVLSAFFCTSVFAQQEQLFNLPISSPWATPYGQAALQPGAGILVPDAFWQTLPSTPVRNPAPTTPIGDPEPRATVAAPAWGGWAVARIYIDPQSGLQSYVAAAIMKKHVPVVVTQDSAGAQFLLSGTIDRKTESAGSKIARCLFLYCVGIEGVQTVTVNLMNAQQEVIWAYTVKKPSANAFQSTAEAVAKHLKKFLEQRPM